MSIYIRGVDLPRDEWLDIRVRADGPSEAATKEHPYWREIEAVQVDEPDGGLISRSEKPTSSDLISRQDAIDALGEEPPVWYDGEDEIAERNQWRRDKAAIESLPSAEPTGECKDCTHWDKLDYGAPRQGWCDQFEDWTDADEYCSRYAKMRGDKDV